MEEEVAMKQRRYWFDPIQPELTTADVMADLDPGVLEWTPAREELER